MKLKGKSIVKVSDSLNDMDSIDSIYDYVFNKSHFLYNIQIALLKQIDKETKKPEKRILSEDGM